MSRARRPREARPAAAREAGFSLIEIVVALSIMSIMAGAGAAVALRTLRGNLQERTLTRMKAIMVALIGDPARGDYGFLGDMGELPDTSLTQLVARGSLRLAVPDPVDGIVSGWNGPYILDGVTATAALDAWGSSLVYTPGTAKLTSLGPDRQLGTADDIVYPSSPPPMAAEITVLVKGQLASGGPPIALRSDEASVTIYYTRASDNTRVTATVAYTGSQGSGLWNTTTAVHLGEHGILVTGLNATAGGGRNYAGSTARDIARVDRGSAFVTVVLSEGS